MKHLYLVFLNFAFNLLDFIQLLIKKDSFLLKHKLKIGILILTMKTSNVNAQYMVPRVSSCYLRGGVSSRNHEAIDLSFNDRISLKTLDDNALSLKVGYRSYWKSAGISTNYNFPSNSFSLGPYFRVFTVEHRTKYKHFVEANYQFNFSNPANNELNISSGFVFFHQHRFCFELSCQYTHQFTDENANYFRPVVGVHYYIDTRDIKRRKELKKQQQSKITN